MGRSGDNFETESIPNWWDTGIILMRHFSPTMDCLAKVLSPQGRTEPPYLLRKSKIRGFSYDANIK